MREKWSVISPLRRGLLLVTVGLMLLFAVLYAVVSLQVGVEYGDDFYKVEIQGDAKVYTGVDHGNRNFQFKRGGPGKKTVYTVTETPTGYTVICQIEGEDFGPYRVEPFPVSELPEKFASANLHGALQIWDGEELLFRGGYHQMTELGYISLIGEDSEVDGHSITVSPPPIPEAGPDCYDLCRFTLNAEESMTHRGNWFYYAVALFFAVMNALFILYAEEFFIWQMSFRVKDPEQAEPSDWELFDRQLSWWFLLFIELIFLLIGLSQVN